jgi:uncharacterized repeat protein (TIGR03803 family)
VALKEGFMMETKQLLLCVTCALAAMGLARAQTATETVLHNFTLFPNGASPYGTLAIDSLGNLYGTTYSGGQFNLGTVFEYSTAGKQSVWYSFQGGTTDGSLPTEGVTLDSAGNLYGTTYTGGTDNLGVVYKVTAAGQETILHCFAGGTDGSGPQAGVAIDAQGNVYGTTYNGGAYNAGVVYKITASGQESVLYAFTGGADGGNPYAAVTLDSAGNLWGTVYNGGAGLAGAIYKISPSGQETVVYSFTGTCGGHPQAGLIFDTAGNLYGTAGLIYKLSPAGQCTVLANPVYPEYGGHLSAGTLAMDSAGNLYGTTNPVIGVGSRSAYPNGAVYKLSTTGTITVLSGFPGASQPDTPLTGPGTNAGIVLDASGNVYGTTFAAGVSGAIYKVDTAGKKSHLYNFAGAPGGSYPNGIVVAPGGEIYGTTANGGSANLGVVYKLDAKGQETIMHSFKGGTDGSGPSAAPLAIDAAGNTYGTTGQGGAYSVGTVYTISPSGQETVLYTFTGGADGATPEGGVVLDAAGNLYGTTAGGGSGGLTGLQEGVVFKVTPSGQETVLYSFTGLSDGGSPSAGVIFDPEGNLYGTTFYGGTYNGGVVYRLTPAGQETALYSFTGGSDGADPIEGLVRDSAGNLYGTNVNYGADGSGVLFKLDTAGNLIVLHSFGSGPGGYQSSGLVINSAGTIYGSTASGGGTGCLGYGCGAIFQVGTAGDFSAVYTFGGGADGEGHQIALSPTGALYGDAEGGADGGGILYRLRLQ